MMSMLQIVYLLNITISVFNVKKMSPKNSDAFELCGAGDFRVPRTVSRPKLSILRVISSVQ